MQRIIDFGAFVEIMPGTDGLLHISEIADHRVKDVRDELKEGDQILVKVVSIVQTGEIRFAQGAACRISKTTTATRRRPIRRRGGDGGESRRPAAWPRRRS